MLYLRILKIGGQMVTILIKAIQILVGVGLLNVWLLRANLSTAYRGGAATNLREEFATYGLPPFVFYLVGFLKVTSALLLLAGLWFPGLVFPAAAVIVVLMAGAVSMHIKIRDPLQKALPAAAMLTMSLLICTSAM